MRFKLECYELQELMKIKYGKNQKKVEDENGEFPILGTGGVMGYANKFLYDKPSVLIGRKGSISKVKYIDKPFWTVDTLFYTEINENKALPLYIYYYLSQIDFNYYNEGTTIPSLRTETLNKIEIYLPNIKVQNKIVDFLSNIDKKIELNTKIISNLEQLSQNLFKHWFIDFEFPNEEGLPYKSSGGEMVESELGEIPKGWNIKNLSENVDFLSGGTPKTKEEAYWNGNIPFFTPKDARKSLYTTTTEKSITDLGLDKCNSKLYPKNTLFITARGTVGKLALANRPMAMNQSCFALKHKEGKQFYLYNVVENLVKEIILGANGAVFNAINLNDLKRLKYAYSNERLIINFENKVSRFYEKMSLLEEENINLQQLRDTLLPKLLSGEIEIPDDLEV